jgi:hypothetical protein
VTCTFVCEAATVEEPPVEHAWEPSAGWDAVLRRRRHLQVALLAPGVLTLSTAVIVRGDVAPAVLPLLGVVAVAVRVVAPLVHARSRAAWEADIRRTTRVEHALRHHAGVGADFLETVTERAEEIDALSRGSWIGWPVAAVIGVLVAFLADAPSVRVLGGVLTVVAVALLVRSQRRGRRARRWLADPLPRS